MTGDAHDEHHHRDKTGQPKGCVAAGHHDQRAVHPLDLATAHAYKRRLLTAFGRIEQRLKCSAQKHREQRPR